MHLDFKLFENTITHLLRYNVFAYNVYIIFSLGYQRDRPDLRIIYIFYYSTLNNSNRNSEFNL